MVWLPDGVKELKICSFVLTEFTNVKDGGRTDRRTPHDAWRHRSRGKKLLNPRSRARCHRQAAWTSSLTFPIQISMTQWAFTACVRFGYNSSDISGDVLPKGIFVTYFGAVWHWPLTSWPLKVIVSWPFHSNHFYSFSSKWVHSFAKHPVDKITSLLTNERTDRWTGGDTKRAI